MTSEHLGSLLYSVLGKSRSDANFHVIDFTGEEFDLAGEGGGGSQQLSGWPLV